MNSYRLQIGKFYNVTYRHVILQGAQASDIVGIFFSDITVDAGGVFIRPLAEFTDWYDVLRNELPLYCVGSYVFGDPNYPTDAYLVTTEEEPTGEGPEGIKKKNLLPPELLDIMRRTAEVDEQTTSLP